jgi:hypothetical protein
MTPTTDEIIERGLAAASLLSDPTFQSVLKSLAIECFASFTESSPSDATGREDTYNLYRGLQAIEAELNARVLTKDQAVQRLDAEHAEREDGPITIQGNTDR